jgi:hypothetical protein
MDRTNDGLKYIIGKRIAGVVVAASDHDPRKQVFLIFDDGTRFELRGTNLSCRSSLDKTAGLVDYLKSSEGEMSAFYGDLRHISAAMNESKASIQSRESLTGRVRLVLGSRRQAREAIDRAKGKR